MIPEIMIHASRTTIFNLDTYSVINSITKTRKIPEIYKNMTNLPVRVTDKKLINNN